MNLKLIDYIKQRPVITKADIKKIISCNDKYAYLVLERLRKRKIIRQIVKGKYTSSDDIYEIASHIEFPAYISFLTASMIKRYTEQIINNMQIMTTINKEFIFEGYSFSLIKTNFLFGYEKSGKKEYFIADDEKLLLDLLQYQKHAGNFNEIIKVVENMELRKEKIIDYLKKIRNTSLTKRAGFLLEKYKGIDISDNFRLDNNPVILDLITRKNKHYDKKWRVKYVFY